MSLFKKVACFTDIHFGKKNNSKVFNEDALEFVKWFVVQAKERGCETCIMLGDWHDHRNTINVATLNYTVEALGILNDSFEHVYIISGNHDLYYREKRELHSLPMASNFENITVVDDILEKGDVCIAPWLVEDEWKELKKSKSKYMFGHFEFPGFMLNVQIAMPDHGGINGKHFTKQEYVFSGHFHARQFSGNIHYIGNPFGHNYSDSMDNDRGAMFLEWDGKPEYVNYEHGPRYVSLPLSELIDKADAILTNKTYVQAKLDIDISYEEAGFLKDTFIENHGVREFKILQSKVDLESTEENAGECVFETVDKMVVSQLVNIESDKFSSDKLIQIYNSLDQ